MWAIAKFVAMVVASYLISTALAPKPKAPKSTVAALEDWDLPQTDEGTPRAVAFGTVRQKGYVLLGYGNYRTESVKL
ncbi:hypothetical protein D9M71_299240 [compost metagenome]